ncbi:MAG: hypothetical protein U0821_11030 [Chloroflexota bacterium]
MAGRILIVVAVPVAIAALVAWLLSPELGLVSERFRVGALSFAVRRLWPSLGLLAGSLVIATLAWLPFVWLTRIRHDAPMGAMAAPATIVMRSLAPFWLALLVMVVVPVPSRPATEAGNARTDWAWPALTLGLVIAGLLTQSTYHRLRERRPMAGAWYRLAEDEWLAALSHQSGVLISSLVMVEAVFGTPGLGRLLAASVTAADVPMAAAAGFLLVAVSLSIHLAVAMVSAARGAGHSVEDAVPGRADRRASAAALIVGGLAIAIALAVALIPGGDQIPQTPASRLLPPTWPTYPLGTDGLGRDVAARVSGSIVNALSFGVVVTLIAGVPGIPIGLALTASPRAAPQLSRALDALLAVPPIVIVLLAAALRGPGPLTIGGAIVGYAALRVARAMADACNGWRGGDSRRRAALATGAMSLGVGAGSVMLVEPAASYLGIGFPPTTPSFGDVLASATPYLLISPWLVVIPGLIMTALIAAVRLLGYGLSGMIAGSRSER